MAAPEGAAEASRERLRLLAMLALAFALAYLVAGEDGAPGGPLFAIILVYVCSVAGGVAASRAKLPALSGMLCVGLLLRNLPYVGLRVGARVDPRMSSVVRSCALALILCRAGLAFDVAALRRLIGVVARLAVLPCLAEATTVFLLATLLLGFPPVWAAMLGFVVAPISPAVVVPGLLALQESGYGTTTGIPTMVLAAAPLDDVLCIAGFGICLGFAGDGGGGSWLDFARAPLELALGMAGGATGAAAVAFLAPAGADVSLPSRMSLLMGVALACTFGLKRAGFAGASALSVLILAVGTARAWGPTAKPVSARLAEVWNHFAQPLLFGLVGAAVALDALQPRLVGLGLLMLACSLGVRSGVAYAAVGGRGLRAQERVFTALAWLPKATVQAAIGGAALDEAVGEDQRRMGREILAVVVLAILVTAPAGAIAISVGGPRLLTLDGGSKAAAPEEAVEAAKAQEEGEEAFDVVAPAGPVAPPERKRGAPAAVATCGCFGW